MVRKDVETVLETIKKEKVRWLDFQFLDVPGYLQHITLPAHAVDASSFEDGIGKLDGSSIKGFKAIFESDMLLSPDPKTFAIIPWTQHKTARMLTDVREAGGVLGLTKLYKGNGRKEAGEREAALGPEGISRKGVRSW